VLELSRWNVRYWRKADIGWPKAKESSSSGASRQVVSKVSAPESG
jgi:hypothetical protein